MNVSSLQLLKFLMLLQLHLHKRLFARCQCPFEQNKLLSGLLYSSSVPAQSFDTLLSNQDGLFGIQCTSQTSVRCATPPAVCKKTPYRSLDGSCNHLENPALGIAGSRYGRLLSPRYADGISSPTASVTGEDLPNARQISLVAFSDEDIPDPEYTLVNMQWGQIVTHDMSLLAANPNSRRRCCPNGRIVGRDVAPKGCFPIIVPPRDPAHSQVGTECLSFVRTLTDRDANCPNSHGPAEQLTVVTAYMDLSLVYGNSIEQNADIRAFQGGRMIVEQRNGAQWLPMARNVTGTCSVANQNEICYRAGDVRVNQNPGLTILQTILLREHNRIADTLAHLNPHYDDDTLFQEARKINIAQYQHISYYEWLPILLGTENMLKNRLLYNTPPGAYVNDFNPNIDPSVLNSHATAAFRYFHSQIEGRLDILSEMRTVLGSLRLSDWLNRPGIIEAGDNFDALTRGHATQSEQLTDLNFDRETKHFLFRRNKTYGADLRATDIQRNRDHGLGSYNDFRELCGLKRAYTWNDYTDVINIQMIEKLKTLYASFEDVDLTVGGSLESHVPGTLVGPTLLCILSQQFYRTRVGDRFFYENGDKLTGFNSDQLQELRKASIARLLCDNGNHIESMQPGAFVTVSKLNPVLPCSQIPKVDLSKWTDHELLSSYGK